MRTVEHWIGGAPTAGASTRCGRVAFSTRAKVVTARWPRSGATDDLPAGR